jgi:hypothetical protein
MKTTIKKVRASGGMYVLTSWEEGKQGTVQSQEWHATKEEAEAAEATKYE